MKVSTSPRLARFLLTVRPAPLVVVLKRLLRIQRLNIDTRVGRFCVDPVSILGQALMSEGTFEPGMQKVLAAFLGDGKVFIDLGANEGFFTVLAAQLVGPSGRVVAVEPQDRLISIIETNLRMNNLNAHIVHAAVSDRRAVLTLHLAMNINTGSSGLHRMTKYPLPTRDVRSITLADVLDQNQIDEVDLLKVDIEGSEYEAILGSRNLFIQKRIKAMALELHPAVLEARGRPIKDLTSFLTWAGY